MVNEEIRNRIRLSVAAFAYEFMNDSIMSDEEYDELSKKINKNKDTGNQYLDNWFRLNFVPDSGMWIRTHPQLSRLNYFYKKFYKK